MKKLLALAAMSFAASTAMAGAKLVVRSDYVSTPEYDNGIGTKSSSTSMFKPDVSRLYLSGNVGDATIDAALNLRSFVLGNSNTEKVMTIDKFVQQLFIKKGMGDWSFTAGKLWMNVGGFERSLSYAGDTYLLSLANGGAGGLADPNQAFTGNLGSVVTPENLSGVGASYAINADHKVEFQVTNQTNTDSELTTATNRKQTLGAAYWGSFANKMVETFISYTVGAADTTSETHEVDYIGAGFRVAPIENLSMDLEYLSNTNKDTTNSTKDVTTSTIVELRYKMGMYTPVFKYETSADKRTDADQFKRNAYALALEIAPKAEDAFRYHVAYTSVSDKDFGGTLAAAKDNTKNMITLGFKYTGDLMK